MRGCLNWCPFHISCCIIWTSCGSHINLRVVLTFFMVMQGPLSSIFPIENRITPVPMNALKNHLDRTRSLPFVKRISDFHLLLLLARFLDVNADVPALAQCVQTQMAVPEGYQLLIESMASAAWFCVRWLLANWYNSSTLSDGFQCAFPLELSGLQWRILNRLWTIGMASKFGSVLWL